jgi:alpha-L-fucosidase
VNEFTGTYESLHQHPLPQWFDDAKFGIFVHWYPSSVPAFAPITGDLFTETQEKGEETAFRESPYSEWYWNSLAIEGSSVQKHHRETYGDKPYEEFVEEFFALSRDWQAKHWANLFAAAGARYCIMGSKHIDGVQLWPGRTPNPFKGDAWTSKRDIVGECVDAVRTAGLRAGLYYCGGLDLTFQGRGYNGWGAMLAAVPQSEEYFEYSNAHYRELIERYEPDVLWNDVGYPGWGAGAAPLIADYYNSNPDGLVNDRFDMIGVAQGTAHADFITPEYSSERLNRQMKFETCRGIGTSFGYNRMEDESTYASAEELIVTLVNIVADGGNFLLNVGPMATGEIPLPQQQRLLAIGQWLANNGAAIYGSQPHEKPTLSSNQGHTVRLTRGSDGETYALILGKIDAPQLNISGLPQGGVTVLDEPSPLKRTGDVIDLPSETTGGPVTTLKIS